MVNRNIYKQIPLYFHNRRSQRLQIWHAPGVCQGPSPNPTQKKKGHGPKLEALPKLWGSPLIFFAMAEVAITVAHEMKQKDCKYQCKNLILM